jgi:DNA-binding response OmpR family regulator
MKQDGGNQIFGTRPRVLIAEDEAPLANLLAQAFSDAGFQVDLAVNGIDCMNKLNSVNPDVVIMDIMMPKLDGIDTTRLIRRNPAFRKTVIVALTARTDPQTRADMLQAGANIFLSKPFVVADLMKTVKTLLLAPKPSTGR